MTDRELLQQALDALEYVIQSVGGNTPESFDVWFQKTHVPAEALRTRLAKPEQEHSEHGWKHEISNAWAEGYEKGRVFCGCGDQIMPDDGAECGNCVTARKAVKREWQTLTDDEIRIAWGPYYSRGVDVARVIEALLKKRNT